MHDDTVPFLRDPPKRQVVEGRILAAITSHFRVSDEYGRGVHFSASYPQKTIDPKVKRVYTSV